MSNWKPQVGEKCLWMGAEVTVEVVETMARVAFGDGSKDAAPLAALRPLAPRADKCGCEAVTLESDNVAEAAASLAFALGVLGPTHMLSEGLERIMGMLGFDDDGHAEPPAPTLEPLSEEAIVAVLSGVDNRPCMSVAHYNYARALISRFGVAPPAPKLEPLEEEAVVNYLCGLSESGEPLLYRDQAELVAHYILARFGVAQPEPVDREKLAVSIWQAMGSYRGVVAGTTIPQEVRDEARYLADALLPLLAGGDAALQEALTAADEDRRRLTANWHRSMEFNDRLRAERDEAQEDAAEARREHDGLKQQITNQRLIIEQQDAEVARLEASNERLRGMLQRSEQVAIAELKRATAENARLRGMLPTPEERAAIDDLQDWFAIDAPLPSVELVRAYLDRTKKAQA